MKRGKELGSQAERDVLPADKRADPDSRERARKIRAVIVALDSYASAEITPLRYAVADAKAFASALRSRFFDEELDICVLCDEEATKRKISIAIADALPRDTGPDDIVVLYFAGHGSPEVADSSDRASSYLVVHDTRYESLCATGIDLEHELVHWLKRIASPRLITAFVDTCFSGLAGGRTFEGPHLRRLRERLPVVRGQPLRALELGEGRLIMTACDDDQVAREDSALGHGVFTYYLLDTLTSKTTGSHTIDLAMLYQKVALKVREHTRGEQIPVINGRSKMARFPMLADMP